MSNSPKIPVLILCGGKGSRFSKIDEKPKQLSILNGKPIIIHIIDLFFKSDFNYFILPLGYKKKMFMNFFNSKINQKKFNLNLIKKDTNDILSKKKNILIFDAKEKTNKLQRIKKSLKFINSKKLIVTYGDGISNVNINSLVNFSKKSECTLTAFKIKSQYGHLELKKNILKKFIEKPFLEKPINIGFYVFNKKLIQNNYKKNIDLEDGLLPKLAKKIKIFCYFHRGYFYSVDNPKDLENLKKIYAKR